MKNCAIMCMSNSNGLKLTSSPSFSPFSPFSIGVGVWLNGCSKSSLEAVLGRSCSSDSSTSTSSSSTSS